MTGDLFRRDADGDYWRVDGAGDVIHTTRGPVFTTPIRDALSATPAVDLSVAYGVPRATAEDEIAMAAVTLRAGRELTARVIDRALAVLPRDQRPAIVQVVDRIPVTTWFRPITRAFRAAGVPGSDHDGTAWYLDDSGDGTYRPLGSAARWRRTRPGGTDAEAAGIRATDPTPAGTRPSTP